MARAKAKNFIAREKPPKRSRVHKKKKNKSEKRQQKKYNRQGR